MTTGSNKLKTKFAVTITNKQYLTPLDELRKFKDWLNTDNYVEIGKMLNVSANKANRLYNEEDLPDKNVLTRMRNLMEVLND